MIAVVLSARGNVWSWPIGIINVVLLFFLFYQVQLYPDMFLQVYFLGTNIAGWWRWKNPRPGEENRMQELRVSFLSTRERIAGVGLVLTGTVALGTFAANLSRLFPDLFSKPSAFPFADSFVTVTSLLAQYWMLHKKAECWILWILADIVATSLYFSRGIKFLSLEYAVFCIVAAYGLVTWIRLEKETAA